MTDRVTEVLIAALKETLADPSAEWRLYKSGKLAGLFPGRGGTGGEAAARALDDGLLEVARSEAKGKTLIEWVRLTPRGIDFLNECESPARALHGLRDALRANQQAVPVWLDEMQATLRALDARLAADAQKWQQRLDALTRRVEETLRRLDAAEPPPEVSRAFPWAADALTYLDRRRGGGVPGDCPLPELFSALARDHTELSVGVFHEGLRRLRERRALRLVPARAGTELSQPEFALLDGGAVLYYAAL
jgi:hypothetical protein